MNIRVEDVMVKDVVTVAPDDHIDHARELMTTHSIHMLPVVDGEEAPIGMVTSSDLIPRYDPDTHVEQIMTGKVISVAAYDGVHVAARVMRNNGLHHVLVTHEKRLVGILSSYDLLRLIEDHRFTMKNPPTPRKRTSTRKRRR